MIASPREVLGRLFEAAVAGAMPESATRQAVTALPARSGAVHIIALGKAAHAMASGAVAALAPDAAAGVPALAGGVIVVPAAYPPTPHPSLRLVVGDHPIPGPGSLAAASAIADAIARVGRTDTVLALVSGGGSSLAAAPLPGIPGFGPAELSRLYSTLLASGADITVMNAVRKRFTRWSAGRLATALPGRRVDCLVVSDVLGDDLASISSGPCVPDPLTAHDLVAMLQRLGLWRQFDEVVRAHLNGGALETPKPGDPAFDHVTTRVVVSNHHALAAAAERARALGIDEVAVVPTPLDGEAAIVGARLASELLARKKLARGPRKTRCMLWGGETTVTLGPGPAGMGGRNQELALAAARSLADAGDTASGIALLAAGTDGRDGPTDAAGAIVDGLTWTAAASAGRDPAIDLATHNAYRSLDAASALLRTGHSGTNVMDVVFGLIT